MVQKYLTIFRTVNNFMHIGKDRNTPAMRLGLAKNLPLRKHSLAGDQAGAAEPGG